LTNSAWRILADFYIRSGGFEKNHLATVGDAIEVMRCLSPAAAAAAYLTKETPKHDRNETKSRP
jgi:hypothetical protein